ncbi:Stf0 family sulfotransferase [Kiloniella laminariae]|uniref:Stf0 family sulfotransferase n=1 Tax=Kiloniella laminariae TaxID=454162 RepID=A0ABT4LF19_9PROT|nr:Stf0 family sulfotransferase [Kiloniella laminariae]MCZ4279701.1 Stf0 family sulfotransferase [Kiloniella laminariae]
MCTSPRSGSTLLCRLLAATGKAGVPDSHFHEPSVSAWMEDFGLQADQYPSEKEQLTAVFAAAQACGTGNSDLFGLRLQRHSFDFFMQKLDFLYPDLPSDAERLRVAFGQILFIHLTRPNKLEQAISRLRAEQSGLWHRNADGTELERLSAPQQPAYDAVAIARHINDMTVDDENWTSWFKREGITPLRITYDDLSRDPSAILSGILEELGLDGSIARIIPLPTARLSDEINRSWAQRFQNENEG